MIYQLYNIELDPKNTINSGGKKPWQKTKRS